MELEKILNIPLNIQRFAESGEEGNANEDVDTSKEDATKANQEDSKKVEEKKYTDKELNDISLKNTNKALAKQLKDLGIEDIEKAKAILAKAKEEEEANKSADEKTKEIITQRDKALVEVINSKIENALLKKGVNEKKVERAVRLVDKNNILNEKGEIDVSKLETEIEATLKDFPELITKKEEDNVGFKVGGDCKEDKKDQYSQVASIFGNKNN